MKKLAIYLIFSTISKSYLENIMQCVLLHGSSSSEDSVKFGVQQGSVTGPSFLMVGTHDRRCLQLFPEMYYYASPTLRSETTLPLKKPQHLC